MFEQKTPTNLDKFNKVQQKLGLLVTSKLQNISQQGLKHMQERINDIQKKLMDEINTNQTISRDYRLKLRTFQEQNWEYEQKFRTALKDRSAQIMTLKNQIAEIMQKQNEERFQKDLWQQSNSQQKMEKIEKQVLRVKMDRKQDLEDTHLKITQMVTCNQASVKSGTQLLDRVLSVKEEAIRSNCNKFKDWIEIQQEKGVSRQRQVMENLKATASEIKGYVANEKQSRQQNQERLRTMLQEAARNLSNKKQQ